ncbi:capreomycidine synthase [Lentzea sp. NPDC034063]|uniref:capreomycidine synthase n=1 Tax=unclassified Lentzea TaxID=2643253 RepID=UPI0033E872B6
MKFESSLLEDWMRDYYFDVDFDIGSSGVQDFSFRELRSLLGISVGELDDIVLRDSSSFGGDELRAAVADRWGNGNSDWVMVTHGASEAIYLVMSSLLEPGDELIAVEPVYHSHTSIARSLGSRVVPWKLRENEGFAIDLAELRQLISSRTKAIVVNFPHNPTGTTITEAQRGELIDLADEAGAYLVWDAAFADLVYDADPLRDPTHDYARAISIGTLSKGYGLPGLRFGWCTAHPDVLAAMVHLRDRMTLHLSPLIEFLGRQVARHADKLVGMRLTQARENRELLIRWAAEHADLVDFAAPRGGVTAFPRIKGCADTVTLCRELAHDHRVLLVPGEAFERPGRVRLGFGGSGKTLAQGLDVVGGVLRNKSAG